MLNADNGVDNVIDLGLSRVLNACHDKGSEGPSGRD